MANTVEDDDDDVHALAPFLEETLPALGLDCETYGSYILPLLTDTEAEADPEEWDSVMGLLQASSETHADDDEAWKDLRHEIQVAWQRHRDQIQQEEQRRHERREREVAEQLEREVQEIAEQVKGGKVEIAAAAAAHTTTGADERDAANKRRALLNRFGYEDPDQVAAQQKDDGEKPELVSNREAAKQLEQARQQELRMHKNKQSTKREEQQKTAEAKKNKQQIKEERRKRATKGERRR